MRRYGVRQVKGMALILTLFTVAVLVTLSTSFAILAFNESRTSRGDKDAKLAYQFATAGVDAIMAYMGANVNWNRDAAHGDPVTGFTPTFELAPVPTPSGAFSPFPGVLFFPPGASAPVEVPLTISQDSNAGPSRVVNPTFTWTVQFNNGATIPMDADHAGTLTLVVQRAGISGDADSQAGSLVGNTAEVYLVQATASVFQSGGTTPLSTRTVVARIRQVSETDNSLLIQASKFFDAPGIAKFYTNVSSQQAVNQLNADFGGLSNIGGIPFGAQVQGQITVLNASSNSPWQLNGQAGSLNIMGTNVDYSAGNIKSGNITKFNANVALGQGQAGIQFPELSGATPNGLQNGVFRGGNSAAQGTEIPGNVAGQNAVTQYSNTSHSLQTGVLGATPMITINSASAGNFGTTQVLPSNSPAPTSPIGKDIEVAVDASGSPINGAPPGIAKVKITLNAPNGTDGGSVTIQKIGAYSGAPVPFGSSDFPGVPLKGGSLDSGTVTIAVSDLASANGGLLYVDGGNVEIATNGAQDVSGRLSIVAGTSSQRPTVDATDPTNPSLIKYDATNTMTDSVTGKSIYLDPANPNFINSSGVANFPVQDSTGRWHWPAYNPDALSSPSVQAAYAPNGDSQVISDMIQHDDVTTREGNLTIASSIVPQSGQQPSLGLMAENYILLSDQTNPANNTLTVDATLQSFAHSVQWAGFLNSVNVDPNNPDPTRRTMPGAYFVGMADGTIGGVQARSYGLPIAPNAGLTFTSESQAGHFNLIGSIISPFLDVEGTYNDGTPGSFIGYPNQTSTLDTHAADNPPPFLPNFNHDIFNNPANALNPISYRIESISDLGALATH